MPVNETSHEAARLNLVAEIEAEAAGLSDEVQAAIAWPGVRDALASVPREAFVSTDDERFAYCNVPLPIGHGQTISQPFVVALMTGALNPLPEHRVLEIGTGSGYQAAVLAQLVAEVYSVEIVPELAARARAVLAARGIGNVHLRVGDGHAGWVEAGPFDGIIVTAAAESVPEMLLSQLKPGGRMVIPLGRMHQVLSVVSRDEEGGVRREDLLAVRFVPFVAG
jgi:protein-L-isoaspartate(D-aspartate) O-methyltransferase